MNNSLAKFSLNNSSNSNIKINFQRQKLYKYKSNNEVNKKYFDKIKASFQKNFQKEANGKIFDSKKFSFPYYLYLLNIFNKLLP